MPEEAVSMNTPSGSGDQPKTAGFDKTKNYSTVELLEMQNGPLGSAPPKDAPLESGDKSSLATEPDIPAETPTETPTVEKQPKGDEEHPDLEPKGDNVDAEHPEPKEFKPPKGKVLLTEEDHAKALEIQKDYDHLNKVWRENPAQFLNAIKRRLGDTGDEVPDFDPAWMDLPDAELKVKMNEMMDKKIEAKLRAKDSDKTISEQERSLEEKFPAYKNHEFKVAVGQMLDKLETGELTLIDVVLNAAAVENAQLLIDIGAEGALANFKQKLGMEIKKGDKPPAPKPKAEPSERELRDKQFQDNLINAIR